MSLTINTNIKNLYTDLNGYGQVFSRKSVKPSNDIIDSINDDQLEGIIVDISELGINALKEYQDGNNEPSKCYSSTPAYTGMADVDNAIISSLDGCSENLKAYSYDIIRSNFLISNVENMYDDERQKNISLGMAKAHYIADNYLDTETGTMFLDAMSTIAKIATNAVVDENGNVSYDLPLNNGVYLNANGLVDSGTDAVDMMKALSPEVYSEYKQTLQEAKLDGNEQGSVDALKILVKWANNLSKEKSNALNDYEKYKTDQIKELEKTTINSTFDNADTSNIKAFISFLNSRTSDNQLLLKSEISEFEKIFGSDFLA